MYSKELEKATWSKGLHMYYYDKEGYLVEHKKDGTITKMSYYIGKAKYGIIENGIFGTRIISGIITGIQFTEDKPIFTISFGKDTWQTREVTDNVEDIFKALNLVSLDRVKETHGLKIKYKMF